MVPSANGGKDDWFAQLDAELEKKTQNIINDSAELRNQKGTINRALMEDFAKIQARFARINVLLTMEPPLSVFVQPTSGLPEDYTNLKLRDDFDFSSVNNIQLIDRTQEQGRMGDSLKAWYYTDDGSLKFRMVFEYCEGEHYYKYAGWKRVFGQFIIYDSIITELEVGTIHDRMAEVVKSWYESHLRRNREVLISALKDVFEKGETFTE